MNPGSLQDQLRETIRQIFRQSYAHLPVESQDIPKNKRLVLVMASDDPTIAESKEFLRKRWEIEGNWFELPFAAGIRCSVPSPRPFAPGVQWGVDLRWSDSPLAAGLQLLKRVRQFRSLRKMGSEGVVFLSPDELGVLPAIDILSAVFAGEPVWVVTGIQNRYRLSVLKWCIRAVVIGLIRPADGALAMAVYLLLRAKAGVRLS